MAIKPPKRFEVVSYRDTSGAMTDVVVTGLQETAPAAADITIATNGAGGTLAAATYSYRVSAVIDGIETQASTAKTQVTTGSTSTVNMPTMTFTDTGAVTPSGALPAASTAVSFRNYGTKATQTNVAAATAMKQTNVYYNF